MPLVSITNIYIFGPGLKCTRTLAKSNRTSWPYVKRNMREWEKDTAPGAFPEHHRIPATTSGNTAPTPRTIFPDKQHYQIHHPHHLQSRVHIPTHINPAPDSLSSAHPPRPGLIEKNAISEISARTSPPNPEQESKDGAETSALSARFLCQRCSASSTSAWAVGCWMLDVLVLLVCISIRR